MAEVASELGSGLITLPLERGRDMKGGRGAYGSPIFQRVCSSWPSGWGELVAKGKEKIRNLVPSRLLYCDSCQVMNNSPGNMEHTKQGFEQGP